MAYSLQCPQCGKRYQTPKDLSGQRVKCSACAASFVAQAAASASKPLRPAPPLALPPQSPTAQLRPRSQPPSTVSASEAVTASSAAATPQHDWLFDPDELQPAGKQPTSSAQNALKGPNFTAAPNRRKSRSRGDVSEYRRPLGVIGATAVFWGSTIGVLSLIGMSALSWIALTLLVLGGGCFVLLLWQRDFRTFGKALGSTALLLFVVLGGMGRVARSGGLDWLIGNPQWTHAAQFADIYRDTGDLLARIQDAQTARELLPKIAELNQKAKSLPAPTSRLKYTPSALERSKLAIQTEFSGQMHALAGKIGTNLSRLRDSPLWPIVVEHLAEFAYEERFLVNSYDVTGVSGIRIPQRPAEPASSVTPVARAQSESANGC